MTSGSIIHAGATQRTSQDDFNLIYRDIAVSYNAGDNIQSHAFSSDGFTLYTGTSGGVREHTLTTAFDIRTASFTTSYNTGGTNDIEFSEDGLIVNILDYQTNYIVYDLTTPFDLSTRTNERTASNLGQEEGFTFAKSGSEIHICRRDSRRIEIYSLSSPFDASTRGNKKYEFVTDVRSGELMDLVWSNDGKSYYTIYRNPSRLEQLSVVTPFDPRSPTLVSYRDSEILDDGGDTDQKSLTWSSSGKLFHHSLYDSQEVYQWEI